MYRESQRGKAVLQLTCSTLLLQKPHSLLGLRSFSGCPASLRHLLAQTLLDRSVESPGMTPDKLAESPSVDAWAEAALQCPPSILEMEID